MRFKFDNSDLRGTVDLRQGTLHDAERPVFAPIPGPRTNQGKGDALEFMFVDQLHRVDDGLRNRVLGREPEQVDPGDMDDPAKGEIPWACQPRVTEREGTGAEFFEWLCASSSLDRA